MRPVRVLQVLGGSDFGGAVWVVKSYVEALQAHGCEVTVCTSIERVAAVFREIGCDIVAIEEMVRPIDPWRDFVSVAKLARHCRRRRYDVVHTHTSKGGFVGRAAATLAGVPVVLHTAHGFAFHESSSRPARLFYTLLERLAAHWSDRITTVSEFHRRWALELGIAAPWRIVAIRNGISPDRVAARRTREDVRREIGIRDDAVLIASVGRLAPQKGLETLLDALPDVLQRHGGVQAIFVGDGPLRSELEARAQRHGIAASATFLGFRTDVADLLQAADIVAAPSLWEGLSISVLEAMAMGKAIVASGIGSNVELVDDGASGLLVPPEDPGALCTAISTLVSDPDLRARFGSAAKTRYEREFTEQIMQDHLWDLYRRVLAEKGVRASA